MIGGLSIKNYEKLSTEEETGVAYIYRRTRLNGEALKETRSNRLYSVISWKASLVLMYQHAVLSFVFPVLLFVFLQLAF
jgi:hypothetical protein